MRNVFKATGHGLKHFFGAKESRADLKAMGHQFGQAGTKLKKAEVLAAMGMYTIAKGSPMGLAKNIYDSIKVGKWKYGDMKRHGENVEEFLDNTHMSEDGKRAVARMMRNGGSTDAIADLSPADAAAFRQFETELHIEAGHCVNF
jgi:hypothetical protein